MNWLRKHVERVPLHTRRVVGAWGLFAVGLILLWLAIRWLFR